MTISRKLKINKSDEKMNIDKHNVKETKYYFMLLYLKTKISIDILKCLDIFIEIPS